MLTRHRTRSVAFLHLVHVLFFLEVMMKAHKEGVAVVGTYAFETAEARASDKLIL